MKMRNDARKVISQHIINAVNELGGKAHSDDVKAWILATENAQIEDFGREKPNTKYPEGRLKFASVYVQVQGALKKEGKLFTPAWAWLSTNPNDQVDGKKKPKRVAEDSAPAEVVSEPSNAPVPAPVPHAEEYTLTEKEAETLSEEYTLSAEEVVEEVVAQESLPAPVVEEVEEPLSEVERNWVEPRGREIEAYIDENGERVGIDENGREWRTSFSEPQEVKTFGQEESAVIVDGEDGKLRVSTLEGGVTLTRKVGSLPSEYEEPLSQVAEDLVEEPDVFDDEEEEIIEAHAEVISEPVDAPVIEEEEEIEEEEVIEEEEDLLAGVFDDDDEEEVIEAQAEVISEESEALDLMLEKIDGYELWGKVEDGSVFLSTDSEGNGTLRFSANAQPFSWAEAPVQEKQKLVLDKARSVGLPHYAKMITSVALKAKENAQAQKDGFATHNVAGKLGCFGSELVDTSVCEQRCPLAPICKGSERVLRG